MKGLFIPEITAEMFRNGCLESIEALMAEGKIYDIDYQQPCEDAISRDAVEKITWEEPSYDDALNVLTEVRDKVRALPSVNAVIIPEGATNGYVMQEVFPNENFGRTAWDEQEYIDMDCGSFDGNWWNAPYNVENEVKTDE